MLTAHDAYKSAHESLFSASTADEIFMASKATVENYNMNRLIWEELNHYKKTGLILGRHPIFVWMVRRQELRGMKVGALVNQKIRLENNLVRNRAAVRKQPQHPLTGERIQRIAAQKQELDEINLILSI